MRKQPVIIDDLPRWLTLDDYDKARRTFVELCRSAGITEDRIAFFGSVSCPGVSDLDAAVFGSALQIKLLSEQFKRLRLESADFASVYLHPPVYLLDSIAPEKYCGLHSFYGMLPISIPSCFDGLVDAPPLHHWGASYVWFTYVVRTVLSCLRRRKLSLRMMLMLSRNLEHSENWLRDDLALPPHPGGEVKDLRRRALDSQPAGYDWVRAVVERQLAELLPLADRYADKRVTEGADSHGNLGSMLWVGKDARLRCASSFGVRHARWCYTLNVNPMSFELARQFLSDHQPEGVFGDYLDIAQDYFRVYREAGIEYPFVTPFAIMPALKSTLAWFNRMIPGKIRKLNTS